MDLTEVGEGDDNIRVIRIQYLPLDLKALVVGRKGRVQVLSLEVKVSNTIQQHCNLAMVCPKSCSTDSKTLLCD